MKNRGYTLIELALGIALLGLLLILVWRFAFFATQRIAESEVPPALAAADQALAAFAAAHHRLPCPASPANDGVEDCSGAAVGRLPVTTLGLARPDLAMLRYGVFRVATANGWTDADLAVARDRLRPLLAIGAPPTGVVSLLGASNGLDFCEALRLAGAAATDAGRLHIRDQAGHVVRNVAYALAAPGGATATATAICSTAPTSRRIRLPLPGSRFPLPTTMPCWRSISASCGIVFRAPARWRRLRMRIRTRPARRW